MGLSSSNSLCFLCRSFLAMLSSNAGDLDDTLPAEALCKSWAIPSQDQSFTWAIPQETSHHRSHPKRMQFSPQGLITPSNLLPKQGYCFSFLLWRNVWPYTHLTQHVKWKKSSRYKHSATKNSKPAWHEKQKLTLGVIRVLLSSNEEEESLSAWSKSVNART